jgi:hypothetical protein
LPGVQREPANLREAAGKQLGPEASRVPIEDAQLLRRLRSGLEAQEQLTLPPSALSSTYVSFCPPIAPEPLP